MNKLRERLAAVKDQLPERIRAELLPETVTTARPSRKGAIMASLYMLGASYGQIMHLFAVTKATVHQAICIRVGPKIRASRPRYANRPAISHEQVSAYYQAALRSEEMNALALAKEISFAKLEDEEEDKLY